MHLEDEEIHVNGVHTWGLDIELSNLPADAEVAIVSGVVGLPDDKHIDLVDYFKQWKENQNRKGLATVVITIPIESMDALRETLEPLEAKIVRVNTSD